MRLWAVRLVLAVALLLGTAPFLTTVQQSLVRREVLQSDSYPVLLEFPSQGSESAPPLIVALHGYGGDVGQFREESQLFRLTDQGYVVMFVQALLDRREVTHWNAGLLLSDRDDVSNLVTLIRRIQARYGYDRKRTYLIGYSNGGYMGYTLACRTEGVLAAVITVNATMSGADWAQCTHRGAVPVLHWAGTADDVVPPDGSMSPEDGWGGAPAAEAVVAAWAQAGDKARVMRDMQLTDRLFQRRFQDADGRVGAVLVLSEGQGHDWPSEQTIGFDVLPVFDAFLRDHSLGP